jgi:hypothetical protein
MVKAPTLAIKTEHAPEMASNLAEPSMAPQRKRMAGGALQVAAEILRQKIKCRRDHQVLVKD